MSINFNKLQKGQYVDVTYETSTGTIRTLKHVEFGFICGEIIRFTKHTPPKNPYSWRTWRDYTLKMKNIISITESKIPLHIGDVVRYKEQTAVVTYLTPDYVSRINFRADEICQPGVELTLIENGQTKTLMVYSWQCELDYYEREQRNLQAEIGMLQQKQSELQQEQDAYKQLSKELTQLVG